MSRADQNAKRIRVVAKLTTVGTRSSPLCRYGPTDSIVFFLKSPGTATKRQTTLAQNRSRSSVDRGYQKFVWNTEIRGRGGRGRRKVFLFRSYRVASENFGSRIDGRFHGRPARHTENDQKKKENRNPRNKSPTNILLTFDRTRAREILPKFFAQKTENETRNFKTEKLSKTATDRLRVRDGSEREKKNEIESLKKIKKPTTATS